MSRTLSSPRHLALRDLLVSARRASGLTQTEVAAKLGRYQSYVANIESGQRRVDVIELLDLAAAIGVDPAMLVRRLVAKAVRRGK